MHQTYVSNGEQSISFLVEANEPVVDIHRSDDENSDLVSGILVRGDETFEIEFPIDSVFLVADVPPVSIASFDFGQYSCKLCSFPS